VYGQLSEYGIEPDVDIGNSAISMYAKCGCMPDALQVFRAMPMRSTKSWNILIDGFVQNQRHKEALTVFQEMISSINWHNSKCSNTCKCLISMCSAW
jgi:pentatricopeptide repeat protein